MQIVEEIAIETCSMRRFHSSCDLSRCVWPLVPRRKQEDNVVRNCWQVDAARVTIADRLNVLHYLVDSTLSVNGFNRNVICHSVRQIASMTKAQAVSGSFEYPGGKSLAQIIGRRLLVEESLWNRLPDFATHGCRDGSKGLQNASGSGAASD